MQRQCPKPKRKRDATWFRDNVLLVEEQGSGTVLNEEELEFLAEPRVTKDPNDFSTARQFYGQFVKLRGSIFLSKVNKDNLIANESLSTELERYKERVKLLEERQNVDLSTREKLIMDDIFREKNAQFADFEKEINYLKQTLSEQSKEKELLTKTFNVFKNKSKEKEAKNIDKEIALEKKVKELDNIIRPMLYDGSVIAKETNVISIADSEETLMLEKEKLSDEQAFRLQTLHPNTDQSASLPVKIEAPQELPKCLKLEAKLIKQHNMVEKDEYNRLSKSFFKLEQHCISLKLAMQLNKEIFQKNNTSINKTEPSFDQLFELNNLKTKLQAKDTTIEKLKANIKRLNKTSPKNSVKRDIDEIETINIELEHSVTKLIAKNEHLKQTYKQLYDSIKPLRVRAKEHVESLVNQLNQKSVEITDLNAQLEEKVFVITALKNNLRKFKGKDIVDNAAQVSNATTIALGIYKLNPITLALKDKNNKETHIYYLKHTME
ncbi:hypothetical protein Tco_0585326 [Tanacetum coccineum]